MATRVATKTISQTRAPLRVPKRPPMNHVAMAIQKWLPYVVVFLLSLVVYNHLRPSFTTTNSMGTTLSNTLGDRADRLEEARLNAKPDANAKPFDMWKRDSMEALKHKLSGADKPSNPAQVVSDMRDKVFAKEILKSKTQNMMESAQDMWKTVGGQEGKTQDFAYDEMYAWKQKTGTLKEAKDKLKDIKGEVLEAGKEKVEGVIEKASEGLQSVGHKSLRAIERVAEALHLTTVETPAEMSEKPIETAQENAAEWVTGVAQSAKDKIEGAYEDLTNRFDGLKEGVKDGLTSQAFYDHTRRVERFRGSAIPSNNSTMMNKISSLLERVKAGLVADEEVRHAADMKASWAHASLSDKVEGIVSHLCMLGDDLVEEVIRKLEHQRAMGYCFDHDSMCPK